MSSRGSVEAQFSCHLQIYHYYNMEMRGNEITFEFEVDLISLYIKPAVFRCPQRSAMFPAIQI